MQKASERHKGETESKANLFANQCTKPIARHETRKASEQDVQEYLRESEARVALMLQKGLR